MMQTQLFISQTAPVAACVNSEYFNKYKHLPENLTSQEPETPESNNEEIVKELKALTDRLDKLEKPLIEEPEPKENQKVKQLKAKLALEITI